MQCFKKLSEQSAVQMCANNLDPQIATYIGTAEPQNFDALVSKASNVERQLARQKATQPKREEGKRPIKKGESMLPSSKQTQSHPMVKISTTTKASKKREADDSPSKKRKKRSISSITMMLKGYLMS